jgi:hypothetical protein
MKRLIVSIALVTQCIVGDALDLKGVRLGMTMEELQLAFPAGKPGRAIPGEMWCVPDGSFCSVNVGTLGGVPTTLQATFLDGRVAQVYSGNLHPPQFEQLVETLKTKFGAPTTTTMGEVQNRVGGKFDNPSYVWKFPDGELRASRFMPGAPTLDNSQVEIDSPEWVAKKQAEKAKRDTDL